MYDDVTLGHVERKSEIISDQSDVTRRNLNVLSERRTVCGTTPQHGTLSIVPLSHTYTLRGNPTPTLREIRNRELRACNSRHPKSSIQ